MDDDLRAGLGEFFEHIMQGDFTYRMDSSDALAQQANQLAAWLEQAMLKQLDDAVSMTMDAFETTISMGKLHQDVGVLEHHAMTMASASEEMSANVKHVAERISAVNTNISQANRQSHGAVHSVTHASEAMNNINQRVDDARERVQALAQGSKEIGGILTAIQNISGQTNLLALNATIEAARAGEAGLGFAVVADEVKQLSQQTKQAAEEIVEKIQRIQSDADDITGATQEITDAVAQGDKDMHTVKEKIDDMRTAVDGITGEVEQVTQAMNDQADASREVAASVGSTAQNVRNTAEIVESTLEKTDAMEQSLTTEIQELAQRKMHGAILRLAKSDHVLWKKRLINMILERGDIDISTVASHHNCRLGKWYYEQGMQEFGSSALFSQLEAPHEQVHTLGRRAVERYNSGDKQGAIADVDAISPLSEEVIGLLDQLIAESAA